MRDETFQNPDYTKAPSRDRDDSREQTFDNEDYTKAPSRDRDDSREHSLFRFNKSPFPFPPFLNKNIFGGERISMMGRQSEKNRKKWRLEMTKNFSL